MTSSGCEENVKQVVNGLDGIISVKASYENSKAFISFDNQKTNEMKIILKLNSIGYTVKE
jgi:copper chaperone CopZ